MRRGLVLGVLVALGAITMTVSAAQQRGGGAPAPMVVEIDKVRDNLFVLRGGGGNTAALVTAKGVVLVDTKNPGWGQPILEALKKVTSQPVMMVINTHTHGDHVSGQLEFPATVDIVSHENAKASMQKQEAFQKNAGALPDRTFTDRMTLLSGNDRIELYYFGRAHTNGDAWVVFPAARVMHAGDAFAGKQVPLVDFGNGGSGVAYPDTLAKVAKGITGVDTVITGHAAQTMTWADVQQYANFNRDFLQWVREQRKAGVAPEAAAKAYTVPAAYPGYSANLPAFFGGMEGYIKGIYGELGAQ